MAAVARVIKAWVPPELEMMADLAVETAAILDQRLFQRWPVGPLVVREPLEG